MRIVFVLLALIALLGAALDQQPGPALWFVLGCAAGSVLCDIAAGVRRWR